MPEFLPMQEAIYLRINNKYPIDAQKNDRLLFIQVFIAFERIIHLAKSLSFPALNKKRKTNHALHLKESLVR